MYLFIYFFNFIDSWICQLSCAINLSSWHCNILPQRLVFHCCYFGKDHLNRGSLFISLRRTSTDEGGRGIINAGEGFNIDHYQNDNSILVFPRQVSYTRTYSRTWGQGCAFSEKGLHQVKKKRKIGKTWRKTCKKRRVFIFFWKEYPFGCNYCIQKQSGIIPVISHSVHWGINLPQNNSPSS